MNTLRRLETYAVDIVGEYQCNFKKRKTTTYLHTKTTYGKVLRVQQKPTYAFCGRQTGVG